mgnify:CR=1 FL=1
MKRKILLLFLTIFIFYLCGCGEKHTGEMDAVSSFTQMSENCYEEKITIIANMKDILDREEFAYSVIEKYLANDFQSILFSFDELGYPYCLDATVYLTKEDREKGNPEFKIIYKCESYEQNIKDNPDKCELTIVIE